MLSSLYYCESRHLLQPALQGDTVAYKQVSDIQCQEICWIVSSWEREEKSSLLAYATYMCDTSSHQMLLHLWPVNKTQAKKYHIHIPQRDLYFLSIGIPWNADFICLNMLKNIKRRLKNNLNQQYYYYVYQWVFLSCFPTKIFYRKHLQFITGNKINKYNKYFWCNTYFLRNLRK